MNNTALAVKDGQNDTALAVAQEQTGIMAAVGHQVQMIPGVDQGFRYQLPRLGKIHLGVKAKAASGAEYPKATDYFVLPDELRLDEGFREVLTSLGENPDKPRVLPIELPCNGLMDNLRRSCDLYGLSKGLVCRTYDTITCNRVDQQTGELKTMPCTYNDGCKDCASGACHWIHRLRVMLPDGPGIGVWQVDTTSKNNFATLHCEMMSISRAINSGIGGVDLLLTLEPREFHLPIKGKLTTTTAWLMHIRTPLSMRSLRQNAKGAKAYDAEVVEQWDESEDTPVYEEVEYTDAEPVAMTEETDALREKVKGTIKLQHPEDAAPFIFGVFGSAVKLQFATHDQLTILAEALNLRSE